MKIEWPKCRPARWLASVWRGERFATDRFSLTAPGTGGPLAGALIARPGTAPRAGRFTTGIQPPSMHRAKAGDG